MNGNALRALCFYDPKDENQFYVIDDVLGNDHVALVSRNVDDFSIIGGTFKSRPTWVIKPISFLLNKPLYELGEVMEKITGMTKEDFDKTKQLTLDLQSEFKK